MDSGSMDSGLMESRSTSDAPDSGVTILCSLVKPYPPNASLHLGKHGYQRLFGQSHKLTKRWGRGLNVLLQIDQLTILSSFVVNLMISDVKTALCKLTELGGYKWNCRKRWFILSLLLPEVISKHQSSFCLSPNLYCRLTCQNRTL